MCPNFLIGSFWYIFLFAYQKNLQVLHLLINHYSFTSCTWDVCWSIIMSILPSLCIVMSGENVPTVCSSVFMKLWVVIVMECSGFWDLDLNELCICLSFESDPAIYWNIIFLRL